MSLVGPLIFVAVLLPAAIFLPAKANAWIPERRPYVLGGLLFAGLATWLGIQIASFSVEGIEAWEKVTLPVTMGVVGGLAFLVLICVPLFLVDRVTGEFTERVLSSAIPAQHEKLRRLPLSSLFTPISVLKENRKK